MTDTTVSMANRVKQWSSKFFAEYIRSNRFKRYMGTSENSIIQVKKDLTKKKGDAITIPLVGALDDSAGANDGSTSLVGNEKELPNEGHQIKVKVVRDATVVNVEEEQASPINILKAAKVALKNLCMRYLRTDIIGALGMINGKLYSAASEAEKDAWAGNNSDRVLYGSAVSNHSGDNSADLAKVDGTNDKLTRSVVSLAKRMAQNAVNANGDGIAPYQFGEDEETFVMFVPSYAFRDLKEDMASVLTDAEKRGKQNPLFSGPTSLYWDGVVIREIPEISYLSGVGTAGIDVAPCFLCGAQALGVVWAQTTKNTIRKEDDYGFKRGVGFFELRGVDKILWDQDGTPKDWGMVTVFVSGVADA